VSITNSLQAEQAEPDDQRAVIPDFSKLIALLTIPHDQEPKLTESCMEKPITLVNVTLDKFIL
jgi:hypothetical protein